MRKFSCVLATAMFASLPTLAFAAGAIDGGTKQAINWVAIGMFVAFVGLTLGITYWAAKQTASAADFYSAGGGITGFQNGLAIAGDYMSAASFLGISGLVYTSGYDGLIYSVGWLVGWPIVTFLIAEQLRNLGKFTFADVTSFRLGQTRDPHSRCLRFAGHRRLLPDRADGRRRKAHSAAVRPRLLDGSRPGRRPDDDLRDLRRHESNDLGADHQGRAAVDGRYVHGRRGTCTNSASAPKPCLPRQRRCTPRSSQSWSRAA